MTTSVFKVDPRPDRGDFSDGNSAALAWDVLKRAGRHEVPDVVDLSECSHIKPYTVACLCGLGELARYYSRSIEIRPPENVDCANHLARMGVPGFFDTQWQTLDERNSNLVARRVSWPPQNAAQDIVELLASRAELSPRTFPRMVDSLDEVICNALTHADSPIDCIVAGQAFPGTDKVEVAVLDLGQTIRGHLRKHPDYANIPTDDSAILKAMEDGVTGIPPGNTNWYGEPNSGAGLYEIRSYCEGGGGKLTVLSGDCWITCHKASDPVTGGIWSPFRGCLVNIRYFTGNRLPSEGVEPIL